MLYVGQKLIMFVCLLFLTMPTLNKTYLFIYLLLLGSAQIPITAQWEITPIVQC